jgi:hypothetical protein
MMASQYLRSSAGRAGSTLRSPLIHLLLGLSQRVSGISSCNRRLVRSHRITVPLSVAASSWYTNHNLNLLAGHRDDRKRKKS